MPRRCGREAGRGPGREAPPRLEHESTMATAPSSNVAAPARRRPAWPGWGAGLALIGVLVVYPPFRVVSLSAPAAGVTATGSAAAPGAFEPAAFASNFWQQQLQPAAREAPAVAPVLAVLRADPAAAAKVHGHRVGLGSAAYYFARGAGRVTAVERGRLLIDLGGGTVALRTGPVFGNVVRDGCGLLEVNQVPGLAEFNAISAELNRLVEERVQPALKSAAVGATVEFAGCAEAPEAASPDGPLVTFIPVFAEVKP